MILLKNGKIVNEQNEFVLVDLLINEGIIQNIAPNISADNAEVIDLDGKLVAPGFIDVHVHLREPGYEHKETIVTGTAAAAAGGYTTIAAMANTIPVPDSVDNVTHINNLLDNSASVRVLPYASISMGERGEELVDIESLSKQRILGFSDDGHGIQSAGMMYEAMKRAALVNKPIVAHCEDNSLLFGGYVHAGEYAEENGHKGILSASESVQIARDLMLAKETGVHYHICHISTKESVELVRFGKKLGINVTAEVAPHHLILSDMDIVGDDTNYKMNPPLRSREDVAACIEGLLDGTIDCIATDHAPHTEDEKGRNLFEAPFGIVGLEIAFPLMYTHFVRTNKMQLSQLLHCMSQRPAEIFGLPYGCLKVSGCADLTVIDLNIERTVDVNQFKSMGRNTPFNGEKCYGWPVLTIASGRIQYFEN